MHNQQVTGHLHLLDHIQFVLQTRVDAFIGLGKALGQHLPSKVRYVVVGVCEFWWELELGPKRIANMRLNHHITTRCNELRIGKRFGIARELRKHLFRRLQIILVGWVSLGIKVVQLARFADTQQSLVSLGIFLLNIMDILCHDQWTCNVVR